MWRKHACGNVSRLEEIGGCAAKEYSLEKAMEKMKTEWQPMHFEFTPYRDTVSECVSVCGLLQVD